MSAFSKHRKNEEEMHKSMGVLNSWAVNRTINASVLITTYRPDPEKWIDGKIRREQ
jgi:hypothetical protein